MISTLSGVRLAEHSSSSVLKLPVKNRHHIFFLPEFPFKKSYFITGWHSFAVKSSLFCTVFTSDLQQTLSNQAAIMKFRSDKKTAYVV
jgi:hypothetical protein